MLCLSRKVVKAAVSVLFKKIIQIIIVRDIQQMPVIQSCSFQVLIRGSEAHRPHNMQPCTRRGAGSGYISRILRYFRLYENNIELCHIIIPFFFP